MYFCISKICFLRTIYVNTIFISRIVLTGIFSLLTVTCTIMQKNGAGIHLGYATHWDAGNDNIVVAKWPSEKRKDPNARVVCFVTVYGLAY